MFIKDLSKKTGVAYATLLAWEKQTNWKKSFVLLLENVPEELLLNFYSENSKKHSITELSEITGINPKTLLSWESRKKGWRKNLYNLLQSLQKEKLEFYFKKDLKNWI